VSWEPVKYLIESNDERDHRQFLNGPKLAIAIEEFRSHAREHWKYKSELENQTTWEAACKKLFECLSEQGITFEDLL